MRSDSDKNVEKIKTRVSFLINFFWYFAFYGIAWKNVVQPGRPQMII